MPTVLSRRTLLESAALACAATASGAALAKPATVPSIWEGKKMYDTMLRQGTYFTYPGPHRRKVAHVFIDTQCPDCERLFTRLQPLFDRVEVRFYPIAYLGIHSEPQGTTILMSKTPWKVFDEHHKHFRDAEFRGLRYGPVDRLPEELRTKVWTNTKLHRRCGCRAVPYGVYKNSKGEFLPFDENLTTRELARLFELN
jgi:hypothetical protein